MAINVGPRLSLRDVLIVDGDVHAHEQPEQIAPYVAPRWREAVENAARLPYRYLNRPGWSPGAGHMLPGAALPGGRGKAREEIVWSAAQMTQQLAALDIDVGIIFPDHFLKIAAISDGAFAAELARGYHRWLEELWLDPENDLYAAIVAVPHDVDAAVAEIERYAGHPKFVGVFLPTCQVYPLWGHRRYWRIYEVAQEAGLPVMLHSVAGSSWAFPFNTEQHTGIAVHTASHVFAMMANLMSFMETGVPVRFPRLAIVFSEAGLTWVPFLRMRLDKEYNENRRGWPYYADRPSAYIRKMWFMTQPVEEPENPRDLVDLIRIYDGEDQTVFASDWPHHDFDHPRAVFDLPVSDLVKQKLMGLNALRLWPRIRVPAKYAASVTAWRNTL